MSSSSTNDLDSLLSHITSSVQLIKEAYAKTGRNVPSLDDTEPYSSDTEQRSLELKTAVQMLEGACAQLTATVANPYHTLLTRAQTVFELACIRVVTEAKVADYLYAAGECGLSVREISEKTGLDMGKLGRMLRLLATKHFFREVRKDVFVNNRLSTLLLSNKESSSLALHQTDVIFKSAYYLFDTLSDPQSGSSNSISATALARAFDFEKGQSLFSFYSEKDPKRGARFARAMVAYNELEAGSLPLVYPWSSLPKGAQITDVGGGVGHASMELARVYPDLRFHIQDLVDTVKQGEKFWDKEYPEAVEQRRVTLAPIDFFKESPLAGSDIYYIRHVTHNWGDEECIKIFKNVRKAMKPGSKVLVHDYILQHTYRMPEEEAVFTQAPEPLLPNYGSGRIIQYNLDMAMMTLLNAKERTLDEFIALGEQSGLKFSKVYDTGESGIVEYELAD